MNQQPQAHASQSRLGIHRIRLSLSWPWAPPPGAHQRFHFVNAETSEAEISAGPKDRSPRQMSMLGRSLQCEPLMAAALASGRGMHCIGSPLALTGSYLDSTRVKTISQHRPGTDHDPHGFPLPNAPQKEAAEPKNTSRMIQVTENKQAALLANHKRFQTNGLAELTQGRIPPHPFTASPVALGRM